MIRLFAAAAAIWGLRRWLPGAPENPAPSEASFSPGSDPTVKRFGDKVEDLRTTTKWLITVFAGIAGVLTVGIQLSSLGRLDAGSPRLKLALVSGMAAILSVAAILVFAIRVLTASAVTLDELATRMKRNERKFIESAELLGTFNSAKQLQELYRAASTESDLSQLQPTIFRLLAGTNFHRIRRRFSQAVAAMVISGTVTAFAIGIFSWSANPPASSNLPPFQVPVRAAIQLSNGSRLQMTDVLGKDCVNQPWIDGIIIDATATTVDVVTVPTNQCRVAHFQLGSGPLALEGTARRVQSP